MSRESQSIVTPAQFISILRTHPRRWLAPAAAVAALAVVYALVRPATWEASQALIVRNEATTGQESPGKFSHSDEMKTVQETILELARSRSVLADALAEVGPPAGVSSTGRAWPGQRDLDELRKALKLLPPKGAEFGTTEIFYVQVRDRSRARAVALVAAICQRLEARFQHLRDAKATSMIAELQKAVNLARADLAASTAQLAQIEQQVGSDLAELRSLQQWGAGESPLGRTITEIRNELRDARAAENSGRELLAFLTAAEQDPSRLIATPNRLLESQPALKRLKDGLVDAQLRTAELRGRMSDDHPLVQAAHESERQIREHLHGELATAAAGVELDLRLSADRVSLLKDQLDAAARRLGDLAGLRADYANRVAEVQNRSELLERAEQKLAEARASQATAKAASLIARVDAPEPGTRPVGPGRAMIVVVGLVGGLLAGLGTLMMTVDFQSPGAVAQTSGAEPDPRQPAEPHGRYEGNGQSKPTALPAGVLSLKQVLQYAAGATAAAP